MITQPNNTYSPKSFIKGKIAELIFDQMFREAGKFTVIPFGYENTLPEVAQHVKELKFKHILENVRSAPDYVLISQDKTEVFMVEVKYRKNHSEINLIDIAGSINKNWTSIWLFLATQDGFFFDFCTNIIKNKGVMTRLNFSWVPDNIQKKYLELLKEFIK